MIECVRFDRNKLSPSVTVDTYIKFRKQDENNPRIPIGYIARTVIEYVLYSII